MLGLSVTLSVLGLTALVNAQSTFIRNGGFEACPNEESDPPFWSQYQGSSVFVSCSAVDPRTGSYATILGDPVSNVGYQQTSTLVAGQQYYASFSLAHIAGNDGDVMDASQYGFDVTVGSADVGPTAVQLARQTNYLEAGTTYGNYQQYTSAVFTATGNDVVRFSGFTEFGFFLIDDIAIIPDGSPIPSGVFTRERLRRDLDRLEKAKRANPDCPVGHLSCPIPGRIGTECIDPAYELESCGGCVAPGSDGVDCTQLAGVLGVGCSEGSCIAFSCQPGFVLKGSECTKA